MIPSPLTLSPAALRRGGFFDPGGHETAHQERKSKAQKEKGKYGASHTFPLFSLGSLSCRKSADRFYKTL